MNQSPFLSSFPAASVRAVKSRVIIAGWALAGAACAGGTADGQPAPFEKDAVIGKHVLTGPEGVRVRVVQTENAALVGLERVRPDLEGVVLLTELGGSTADRTYLTQLNGRTARILGRRDRDWRLYLMGPIQLEVDETASAALEAEDLIDRHVHQRAKGRLAGLARFDRSGAETRAREKLEEAMGRMKEACGFSPETSVDLGKLSDEELMRYSISGYCDAPRGALERACKVPELKSFVAEQARRVHCTFGESLGLDTGDGTLTFTVHFGTSNQDQWVREAFDKLEVDTGRTVYRARLQEDTTVCSSEDGKHAVVVGPYADEANGGLAYGTPDKLFRQPRRKMLSENWFFEPRYPNPQHNSNFRGYDLRFFSYVSTDEKDRCQLKCGRRAVQLKPVTGADKRAFLDGATWAAIPNPREPYALARDKTGRYYYVDRGATRDTAKDYRLYIGRQGGLRLQKMRDIVSDSEGEIFASVQGRLKLFLGKEEAEWQSGRGRRVRTKKLVRVTTKDNLELIYNRLGVYLGQPLHTPCDDL